VDKLTRLLKPLVKKHRATWTLRKNSVDVGFAEQGRHQTILLEKKSSDYVLTSVVLGATAVTKRGEEWSRLAILAWQSNADQQLVTFGFDRHDRLVGRIRHPAEHLDPEELELYVTTLARECDRFEYLLTGRDAF